MRMKRDMLAKDDWLSDTDFAVWAVVNERISRLGLTFTFKAAWREFLKLSDWEAEFWKRFVISTDHNRMAFEND